MLGLCRFFQTTIASQPWSTTSLENMLPYLPLRGVPYRDESRPTGKNTQVNHCIHSGAEIGTQQSQLLVQGCFIVHVTMAGNMKSFIRNLLICLQKHWNTSYIECTNNCTPWAFAMIKRPNRSMNQFRAWSNHSAMQGTRRYEPEPRHWHQSISNTMKFLDADFMIKNQIS